MPVRVTSSQNRGSVAVCVLLASEWRYSVGKRIPSAHHAHGVSNYNLMLLHQCRVCYTCLIIISVICPRGWKTLDGTTSHHCHWPTIILNLCFPGTFSSSEGLGPCLPCTRCPSGVPMLASCTAKHDTQCDCDSDYFFLSSTGLCAPCTKCRSGEGAVRQCTPQHNSVCRICGPGTFSEEDYSTKPCQNCTRCSVSEVEIRPCMPNSDTLCMGEFCGRISEKMYLI